MIAGRRDTLRKIATQQRNTNKTREKERNKKMKIREI